MKIARKEFESDFFGFDCHVIEWPERGRGLDDVAAFEAALDRTLADAPPGLYEVVLDARSLPLAHVLEERGFRLWDSRFECLTRLAREEIPDYPYDLDPRTTMRAFREEDRGAIREMTRRYIASDPALISKFKSPYFPSDAAERWFDAWIVDSLDKGALCAVLEAPEGISGFFIYARQGSREGIPVYKGILATIAPTWRGRNLHLGLQAFMFREMIADREFYVDNTTQLSNIAAIRNHFASRKRPERIRLGFMRMIVE